MKATHDERLRAIEDAIRANDLAQDELARQRHALFALKEGQPVIRGHLIPYASRVQQAATNGAIAYTVVFGTQPPQTS